MVLEYNNSISGKSSVYLHHSSFTGEIVTFDNQRVLHGRSAFVVTETDTSTRHLEGAYIDWDEACSRMRVIREKMLDLKPL